MKLLSFFFPPRCCFCHTMLPVGASFRVCADCEAALPRPKEPSCKQCRRPLPSEFSLPICRDCRTTKRYFTKLYAPFLYSGLARTALLRYKYYERLQNAELFAYYIVRELLQDSVLPHFDFVTFVPQSSATHRERGYNQSRLLAAEIARLLNLPLRPTLLRTNDGTRQVKLNAAQRRKNVRASFCAMPDKLTGTALLVDDVYTTGATANFCASLLHRMGCSAVYLAVVCVNSFPHT